MKRLWFGTLVLSAALATLGLGASASLAVPFKIGDTVCGDLKKVRTTEGVVWHLSGCDALEAIVDPGEPGVCGNGVLDAGEICDPGDPFTCNGAGPSRCGNCVSCGGGGPTPTPGPTPPPGSADCPQGELPPLGKQGFENWFGRDGVTIQDGQTHTYCFTVNATVHKLEFAVGDKTAGAQCFWHTAEYIPPAGATGIRIPGPQTGRDTSYAFLNFLTPLPKGVWRIKISAIGGGGCNNKYQVVAHP